MPSNRWLQASDVCGAQLDKVADYSPPRPTTSAERSSTRRPTTGCPQNEAAAGLSRQAFLLTNPNSLLSTKRPNNLAGVQRPSKTYLHHGAGKIFSLFVCSIIKTGWAGVRNKATHINDMGGGTRNWDGFGGALALVPCFSLFVFPFFLVCTDGEGLQ